MSFDFPPPPENDSVEHARRYALVVGINDYRGKIRRLETAVPDAEAVAEVLEQQHGYAKVWRLTSEASAARIMAEIEEIRPVVAENSSLLFYFAGHGLTLPSEEGPQGYLIPEDATDDSGSYLRMADVHGALNGLRCRHVLVILDCCFGGAFRWGAAHATRRIVPDGLMYQRTYELYLAGKARQVLVSSSYDQEALELLSGERIRGRVVEDRSGVRHSPFAMALLAALRGEAGLGKGGVLTVTALSEYLRRQVEATSDTVRNRQTPQLWPLDGHDRGEYLFNLPGQEVRLAENPQLTAEKNPYRGLRAYEAEHEKMFHGRAVATAALLEKVAGQPFVVMTGESGSGKSSLMRAGLLPRLPGRGWTLLMVPDVSADKKPLRPLRPGTTPLAELGRLPRAPGSTLPAEGPLDTGGLLTLMREWRDHLTGDAEVLLPIDQFEELVTLGKEVGKDTAEQKKFQEELAGVLRSGEPRLHLLVTLRSDYAPDLAGGPLKEWWRGEALFPTPALSPVELRQIIQVPAAQVALDFANPNDVDALVAEVAQTPNPLPILSCALSELYEHYVAENDESRSLKLPEDFAQGGAVAGSLGRSGNGLRDKLPDDFHREVLDHVLLRFVSFEGGRAARRQVLKGELDYAPPADAACEVVTTRLVERRLLTTGQSDAETPCWELCHDRLLIGWGHYRRLIQEKQETIILQRRLSADMAAGGRKPAPLPDRGKRSILRPPLRAYGRIWKRFRKPLDDASAENLWDKDPRLDQTLAELNKPLPWLNEAETEFINRSQEFRERKRKLWRNGIITLGVVLTSLTVAATLFAIRSVIASGEAKKQTGIANKQTAEAEKQTGIANSAANDSRIAAEKADKSANEARAAETKTRQQLALSQYREAHRMLELGNLNGAASLFLKSHENDPGFLAPIDQLIHLCRNTKLLALVERPNRVDPVPLTWSDFTDFRFKSSKEFLHERADGRVDFHSPPYLLTTGPPPDMHVLVSPPPDPILSEGDLLLQKQYIEEPTDTSSNDWPMVPLPFGQETLEGWNAAKKKGKQGKEDGKRTKLITLYGLAGISPDRKLLIVAGGISPTVANQTGTHDDFAAKRSRRFHLTLLGLPDLGRKAELEIVASSPPAGGEGEISISIESLGWRNDSREFVVAWRDNVLNSLRIDIFTLKEPTISGDGKQWHIDKQASSCFREIFLPMQYYQSAPIVMTRNKAFADVVQHDFGLDSIIANRESRLDEVKITDFSEQEGIYLWGSGYLDTIQRYLPIRVFDSLANRSAQFNTGGEILVKNSKDGTIISAFAGAYREGATSRKPQGLSWTGDGRYLVACFEGPARRPFTWFFEPNSGIAAFERDFQGVYCPTQSPDCHFIRDSIHVPKTHVPDECFYSVTPEQADEERFAALRHFNRLVNPWSVEASGSLIHTNKVLTSTQSIESSLREMSALWEKSLGNPGKHPNLKSRESELPAKTFPADSFFNLREAAVYCYFVGVVPGKLEKMHVSKETSWETMAADEGLPLEFLCGINGTTNLPGLEIAPDTSIVTIADAGTAREISKLHEVVTIVQVAGILPIESFHKMFPPPGRWERIPLLYEPVGGRDPDESPTAPLELMNNWNTSKREVGNESLAVIRDSSPTATAAHKALEEALRNPRDGKAVEGSKPCLVLLRLSAEMAVSKLLAEHSMTLGRLNELNGTAWESATVLPAGTDVFLLP